MTTAATVPRPAAKPAGKRMNIGSVTTAAKALPSRTILHGHPGVGKTALGAHFPSPVFLMTTGETGLITLMQSKQIGPTNHFPEAAETWQDVFDAVMELQTAEHNHKTFILDTLNGGERLNHEHVCRRDYGGDFGEKGFMGFQRGFVTALGDWRNLLCQLDKLRQERGMAILLLCHTKTASVRNPAGPDYDQFAPCLHKTTWEVTAGWADVILYATQEVHVEAEKGKRGKGHAGRRVILTSGEAAYCAKNRHGLPEEIEMGASGKEAYTNLMAAFQHGKAGE